MLIFSDHFKCLQYEDLKKQCEKDFAEILSGNVSNSPLEAEQKVRVATMDDTFCYLDYGEFFFFLDTMYMFVDARDEKYFIWQSDQGLQDSFYDSCKVVPNLQRQKQRIVRVFYAGLQTGCGDAQNRLLFEGDIIYKFPKGSQDCEGGKYARIIATSAGFAIKGNDIMASIEDSFDSFFVGTGFANIDENDNEFNYEQELSFLDSEHPADELHIWLLAHQHTPKTCVDLWRKADGRYLHA